MKRKLVAGLIAAGLIVAGGTGFYLGNVKENSIGISQMTKMMNATSTEGLQPLEQSQNSNFDQMLPYMKKMHPNLSNKELKDLYDSRHGKNGSISCGNGSGMMNNDKVSKQTY